MAATGYIQVHAFTSKAQLPLKDVSVLITDSAGKTIAMRQTDRSGKISPIPVPTPDLSASQSPDPGIIPFTAVNIYARLKNYEQIESENIQVFPNTVTDLPLEMIPLAEFPELWTQTEICITPPQNLEEVVPCHQYPLMYPSRSQSIWEAHHQMQKMLRFLFLIM